MRKTTMKNRINKLEQYRTSMSSEVLHSWAADAQKEIERLRAALAVVYQGARPEHNYQGLCPDPQQPNARDPSCSACCVLLGYDTEE